jgi:hypothetical protein
VGGDGAGRQVEGKRERETRVWWWDPRVVVGCHESQTVEYATTSHLSRYI